jgi:hypothetical protein
LVNQLKQKTLKMNISRVQVQNVNPDFDTTVDKENGSPIKVTGIVKQQLEPAIKFNSVVGDVIDVAEQIAKGLPPSIASILADADAVKKAANDIDDKVEKGDIKKFEIPIETIPQKVYNVFFVIPVQTRTEDTGKNESAEAHFWLYWNNHSPNEGQLENKGLNESLARPVFVNIQGMIGSGSDQVSLVITRSAVTDGAIVKSPCTSQLTLGQLSFHIEES